jgi:hypothetical protein
MVTPIMLDEVARKNKKNDNKQRLLDGRRTILQVKQQGNEPEAGGVTS